MRLSQKQIKSIQENFKRIFINGSIYLFGSRVDNRKKGGDIDLYIVPENKDHLVSKKIQFLSALKRELGEQKIDVVLSYDKSLAIEQIAESEGIRL